MDRSARLTHATRLLGALLEQVGEPELLDRWLWTGPLGRTYLVYAFRLAR